MRSGMKRYLAVARAAAAAWGGRRASVREALRKVGSGHVLMTAQPLEQRVMLNGQQELNVLGVSAFRADPRFAGINGKDQVIVVIDNAFDVSHKEFQTGGVSRIDKAYDAADQDDVTLNVHGTHGTHVASIAAGTKFGIAPGAHLILLKAMPDAGDTGLDKGGDTAGRFTVAGLQRALQWVEDHKSEYHIAAVNMSLGSGLYTASSDNVGLYGANLTRLGSDNGM